MFVLFAIAALAAPSDPESISEEVPSESFASEDLSTEQPQPVTGSTTTQVPPPVTTTSQVPPPPPPTTTSQVPPPPPSTAPTTAPTTEVTATAGFTDSPHKNKGGVIAGAVIGSIAGVAIIALIVYFCVIKKRRDVTSEAKAPLAVAIV